MSIRSFECSFHFSRRRGRKHKLVSCLNCRGQLLFINFCEPRQSCRLFSYNRRLISKNKAFARQILVCVLARNLHMRIKTRRTKNTLSFTSMWFLNLWQKLRFELRKPPEHRRTHETVREVSTVSEQLQPGDTLGYLRIFAKLRNKGIAVTYIIPN